MSRIVALTLSAALLGLALPVFSKNFGTQGTTWKVLEPDMRETIMRSALKVDWAKKGEEVTNSVKSYTKNLPKRTFSVIDEQKTYWIDPSITLADDINIPVKGPDGKYTWQLLHKKGTKANPLDSFRPVTALFFFDGGDPEQVTLMKELVKAQPLRLVPVEAGKGDIEPMAEDIGKPVFYASDAMLTKFNINYLPAMVYPGTGEYSKLLGTTFYPRPFKSSAVLDTWLDFKRSASSPSAP